MTDVSTTWAEVIFGVMWIVDRQLMVYEFNHDVIGCWDSSEWLDWLLRLIGCWDSSHLFSKFWPTSQDCPIFQKFSVPFGSSTQCDTQPRFFSHGCLMKSYNMETQGNFYKCGLFLPFGGLKFFLWHVCWWFRKYPSTIGELKTKLNDFFAYEFPPVVNIPCLWNWVHVLTMKINLLFL